MRPDRSFPLSDWQSFRQQKAVGSLLRTLPAIESLCNWPTPEQWQNHASGLGLWDRLGQTLVFTLEEKPGQRAKRKQASSSPGRSYEASICERQEIPTRAENLHDFFNALIWLNFPLAKFALHRRAYEIQNLWWQGHGREKRCPLADRLTCFDEGGLVFELSDGMNREAVERLLLSRKDEEKKCFVQAHPERFSLFGHGMMEVMMRGNTAIHAACILLAAGDLTRDQRLAAYISVFDAESPDHGSVNVSWLLDP